MLYIKHFIYIPRALPILFLLMFAICISLLSCLSIRIALHQCQILCSPFLPNCNYKPLAQMAVVCFQTAEKCMWLSQNRAVKMLLNHTFSPQHLLLHRNVCGYIPASTSNSCWPLTYLREGLSSSSPSCERSKTKWCLITSEDFLLIYCEM